jgi:type IV fimbrial biogenesis protein FimT
LKAERRRKGKEMSYQKGFSLVEIMIVITLLGILAAIAVPNLQPFMAQRRLNGAARQIMSDLMEARMKTVSQNNMFKVFFLDNHQYKILDDDNSNKSEDPGEMIITKDIQSEYKDVTISNASADPIFLPRGTVAPGSNCTVTLSNASGSKEVTVAITGRVKIIN